MKIRAHCMVIIECMVFMHSINLGQVCPLLSTKLESPLYLPLRRNYRAYRFSSGSDSCTAAVQARYTVSGTGYRIIIVILYTMYTMYTPLYRIPYH